MWKSSVVRTAQASFSFFFLLMHNTGGCTTGYDEGLIAGGSQNSGDEGDQHRHYITAAPPKPPVLTPKEPAVIRGCVVVQPPGDS